MTVLDIAPPMTDNSDPNPAEPLSGEAGFFVDKGSDFCQRCGDTNYTERRVCLTCSGDPSGATFLVGTSFVPLPDDGNRS